jgi:isopentenyl diphosphate isomerase/L-lactate dehydrogenase-like FMN-dependent dehydrogenase
MADLFSARGRRREGLHGWQSGRLHISRNDTLDWDYLRRLRDLWPRPLIVKGILHPDDAVKAAECGADGIIVSNHAGNVLDAAAIPIEMLPHIAAAAGTRLKIIVDSGFRRRCRRMIHCSADPSDLVTSRALVQSKKAKLLRG